MGLKGAMVIGLDAADPVQVKRLMAEGKMPNLKKLLERNRWQCVGVEVSPSSPLSSKYWASKPY